MTTNPFESIENKLHHLESRIDMLTELLRASMQSGSRAPVEEATDGIELAVKVTGLAKGTVYNLVAERKIPHYKRGKRIYFNRQELQNWIKEGRRLTKDELKRIHEPKKLPY
jgi:excisionase family DNA binding protein